MLLPRTQAGNALPRRPDPGAWLCPGKGVLPSSLRNLPTPSIMHSFVLILLLAAFPALSTDMYLPAIPALCELWGISLASANLSLVAFFASFSAFLLVHGALADRFGRRPVLLAAVSLYVAGSLACAGAGSIAILVLARVVQAIGAAGASAMALTLAKDLYAGDRRKKLLAYIGVIIPLCPMVAPTIGALMLQHVSWRGIFLAQALLALPALYGSFRLQEPAFERAGGGLQAAAGRYARLFRNRGYLVYALAFSVVNFAFFAFIGGSPDIYITGYGLDEGAFGLYFAFNALGLMAGSFLCSRLCVGIESFRILTASLLGMLAASAAMLLLGGATPLRFALPMFAYSLFLGLSRPISNDMVLEQVDRDTGAAASLLTFFNFMVGAAAMEAISLGWTSKSAVIAVTGLAGNLAPLAALLLLRRRG